MTYIQVDARGCGTGKTTGIIIPRIKRNLRDGIRTVVVVPSIKLQEQYADALPDATVINSKDKDNENTSSRFHKSLELGDNVIIITHQAFVNHITVTDKEKINTDLIIDEAFDPFNLETLTLTDNQDRSYFKFDGIFYWNDPLLDTIQDDREWHRLHINASSEVPSLLRDSAQWRKITGPNKILWATANSGNTLITGGKDTVQLVTEVDPAILLGWSSVWIAAAAFEYTFMAQWLHKNNINASIPDDLVFVPHKVNLRMHMPVDAFKWSKTLRNAQPELIKIFQDYVNKNRSGRVVYVNNNDDSTRFTNGDKIDHNAHGVNKYRESTDYAHMSALQPNGYLVSFYKKHLGMDTSGSSYNSQITMAFSGYLTYQLVMRTHLREMDQKDIWVNIFLIDSTLAVELLDLFDPNYYQEIPEIPLVDSRYLTHKKSGRKPGTTEPLTNAEKQKIYRLRKKLLQDSKTVTLITLKDL